MRIIGGFIVMLALSGYFIAYAQDDEPQVAYAYVTYFICDPATEARADEIIKRNYAPHYNAAVEHGEIAQWSWLAHYVGGEWRRALVLTALNMDDLLDASGALGEIIEEATPEAGRVFTEVCSQHVDYIWQASAGLDGTEIGAERGEVGFSMYLQCDMGREEEADRLVRDELAEVYDAAVQNGSLASWTWLQHYVGGPHRRLLAMTGPDHKSVMRARGEIISALQDRKYKRFVDELNEICPAHEDYMWDIQVETP